MADTVIQYWSPEHSPQDYVLLAGQQTPGYTEVIGAHAPRKIQIQSGPGLTGARYRFWGMEVCKFLLKIHLQDDQDWIDWAVFKLNGAAGEALRNPIAKAGGSGNGQALVINPITIDHPFLSDPTINITHVIIEDVHQPERVGESTEWTIDIPVIGYRAMKIQQAAYEKPKGAAPDARDQRNLDQKKYNEQRKADLAAIQNTPAPAPKL
jgi:hypothetical protein